MSESVFPPMIDQLQRILDLRVQQHGLISSNLANANTPHYKAQQIDFTDTLREVMERPSAPMPMARSEEEHLGGRTGVETPAEILELEPTAWSPDGNSVNPEEQSALMMENTLMYKTVARLVQRKFQGLLTAIGEGR